MFLDISIKYGTLLSAWPLCWPSGKGVRLESDRPWARIPLAPRLSHSSDLKIGTPVATLPGAWRYRVSAGTGWPDVSVL